MSASGRMRDPACAARERAVAFVDRRRPVVYVWRCNNEHNVDAAISQHGPTAGAVPTR